jgi:hypothetical protein
MDEETSASEMGEKSEAAKAVEAAKSESPMASDLPIAAFADEAEDPARIEQAVLLAKLGIPPFEVVKLSPGERSDILEKLQPNDFFRLVKLEKARALSLVPPKS